MSGPGFVKNGNHFMNWQRTEWTNQDCALPGCFNDSKLRFRMLRGLFLTCTVRLFDRCVLLIMRSIRNAFLLRQ
jgi:hypothetical protein